MTDRVAIVVLTERGLDVARRIRSCLTGARIHGYSARVADVDVAFDDVGTELRRLFADGFDIVGVCSAGILIRTLAPALADKREEPAVIAMAEDGSAVVPLLGGHRGANELARRLGEALGVPAAITTAGDIRWQVALDDPPSGWVLANPHHCKSFMARLLSGEPCRLEGEAVWLRRSGLEFRVDATLAVRVTDVPDDGDENTLVYRRRRFALGVGCERGVAAGELADLVERTLAGAGLSTLSLAGVFSVDLKMDEPAVHALAEALGLPARFFDPHTLEALTPRLANPSEMVFREVGCHGVSEAAALAAAGEYGVLRVAKTKSKRATCAVAEAPSPIDTTQLGRSRGVLTVVGLGPGTPAWRTPAADRAIRDAAHLVGYRGYLDQVPASTGQVRHAHALGEETERVDRALALAAEGHRVALVCSGDPGVYAHGGAGLRAAGDGDACALAPERDRRAAGRVRDARHRGAGRCAAGPRLLRHFAVGPADALADHRAAAPGGGGRRLRRRAVQPRFESPAPGTRPRHRNPRRQTGARHSCGRGACGRARRSIGHRHLPAGPRPGVGRHDDPAHRRIDRDTRDRRTRLHPSGIPGETRLGGGHDERAATVFSPGELERSLVDMRTPLVIGSARTSQGDGDVRTPRGGAVEGGGVAGAWRHGVVLPPRLE